MKYFVTNLECPHCKAHNRVITNPPRRYDKASITVKCWDSEKQIGCLKEFDLHQQIQSWATPTKEQLRINERINSNDHYSDRMGTLPEELYNSNKIGGA